MNDQPLQPASSKWLAEVRARTPARLLVGRTGTAYRTATQLELQSDHAAAVDAVQAELDLQRDLGPLVEELTLFQVSSRATTRAEYLLRPDLGRCLDADSAQCVRQRCPCATDFQVVIGDGLSATAVAVQVPPLLPLLLRGAQERGWRLGQPFVVRHCRVGVLNVVGDLLAPGVVVLLIGERPGLATAESLSAYMAYQPRPGHTDAQRNLISNIHARGVSPDEAAPRILALAEQMRALGASGVAVKEQVRDGSNLLRLQEK